MKCHLSKQDIVEYTSNKEQHTRDNRRVYDESKNEEISLSLDQFSAIPSLFVSFEICELVKGLVKDMVSSLGAP